MRGGAAAAVVSTPLCAFFFEELRKLFTPAGAVYSIPVPSAERVFSDADVIMRVGVDGKIVGQRIDLDSYDDLGPFSTHGRLASQLTLGSGDEAYKDWLKQMEGEAKGETPVTFHDASGKVIAKGRVI